MTRGVLMSDLYKYWRALDESQKQKFADNAGLKVDYIETHLIHKRKTPPLGRLMQMAKASNGRLSYHGLCDFFLAENEA